MAPTVRIRRRAAWATLMRSLRSAGGPGVGTRLRALPRMMSMGLRGDYPHLDRSRIVMAILGLLYLISPIDLMPEALLWIFGLGDDALVAAWLAGVVLSETETFLTWEELVREPGVTVVVGEVVD